MSPVFFRFASIYGWLVLTSIASSVVLWNSSTSSAKETHSVVCRVNGTEITEADVEFAATTQHVKPEERSSRHQQLVDRLIERQLIRDFLAKKKVTAPTDELQLQIEYVESVLMKLGEDPSKFLAKLGYTPDRLKSELGLPLAWQVHARKTITTEQIRAYFDSHRSELDGTQLRARQIFLKKSSTADETELNEALSRMKDIRQQITSKKLTFEEAVKQYSEAPSKEQGGDVGRFGFRGKLPASVSRAAFELKIHEISQPVVSMFGVHLVQVTERHPGDLSLEDVRPQILERLSEQLWNETVEKERKTAKIERVSTPKP